MPSSLTKLGCLFPLLLSCSYVSKAEHESLKETVNAVRLELAQARVDVMRVAAQVENADRERYSDKYCRAEKQEKNEKGDKADKADKGEKNFRFSAKINEFIGEVQASIPEACTEVNMENAMNFMHTQAYANIFFAPNQSADVMHPARREYLSDLIAPQRVHPSTRFLILAQPAEETAEGRRVALKLAEDFKVLVQKKIAGKRELRIIGPHLLPCRMRKEVQRLFNGPMDVTLPQEPKEGQPRVRVWLMRTDC